LEGTICTASSSHTSVNIEIHLVGNPETCAHGAWHCNCFCHKQPIALTSQTHYTRHCARAITAIVQVTWQKKHTRPKRSHKKNWTYLTVHKRRDPELRGPKRHNRPPHVTWANPKQLLSLVGKWRRDYATLISHDGSQLSTANEESSLSVPSKTKDPRFVTSWCISSSFPGHQGIWLLQT